MIPLYDTNPHRRVPWLTLLIIAINVGVMIWLSQFSGLDRQKIAAQYGFVPKRVSQLSDAKLVVAVTLAPAAAELDAQLPADHEVVQLEADAFAIYCSMLSMMFLHGGWIHLLSNMWFLWIFGNNIEDRLGHLIFLGFYLLGGLLATACHWATDAASTIPVIGGSGAVAAVLGAYAITFPRAKVRTLVFIVIITVIDLPALLVLGFWFVQQLLEGVFQFGMNGGVAWWAHVGGFLAGFTLMPLMAFGAPPPESDWEAEADELFK